jgi:ferric-dicitrate binding protein FerR (iron transport regulator)
MNYETIAAYLAGELTEIEKKEVDTWIALSSENQQTFAKWQLLWQTSQVISKTYDPDVDKAWEKIHSSTHNTSFKTPNRRGEKSDRKLGQKVLGHWLLRVAAVFLLITVLAFVTNKLIQSTTKPSIVWTEKFTDEFQTSQVVLPDGSKVWLNTDSRIRYPEKFTGVNREIFLSGEAFFEVTRDEHHPFLVHTGESLTKVLGTSFNIRGYESDSVISLTVVNGKVSFDAKDARPVSGALVEPNQQATLNKRTMHIYKTVNNEVNFLAWKTGKLVFRDARLMDALQALEIYYRVDFETNDSTLYNCRFTGSFDHAPLQEVLEVFSFGSDIDYEKIGNSYVLSGNGCK